MTEFRLETPRLIMRDWQAGDWPRFWQHTNTPAVMRWLGGVADKATRESAQSRVERYRREYGHTFWVLERNDDGGHLTGEMLGFCGLKRSNQAGGPIGLVEVGWRLREDAWGKGYAKEAATAALDWAFAKLDPPEIIALTVPGNSASRGLMIRLGMQHDSARDFANEQFDPEGGRIILYAITQEAWAATRRSI